MITTVIDLGPYQFIVLYLVVVDIDPNSVLVGIALGRDRSVPITTNILG